GEDADVQHHSQIDKDDNCGKPFNEHVVSLRQTVAISNLKFEIFDGRSTAFANADPANQCSEYPSALRASGVSGSAPSRCLGQAKNTNSANSTDAATQNKP